MKLLAAALVGSSFLSGAQLPLASAWKVNPAFASAPPGLGAVLPEVHAVRVADGFVYVETAGLSLQSLAPLETKDRPPSPGVSKITYRLPLQPRKGANIPVAVDTTGIFINGVPIYNPASPVSWGDRNIWHLDSVRNTGPASPVIRSLLTDSRRHSPLIGFALDGYPVYGPYAWDADGRVIRLRSGYRLRRMTSRRALPDGTDLTPAQEGPPLSAEYPLGTFAEDYEYAPGTGDLDQHNGRFTKTPEYPEGTYAYFLATDSTGNPAFPYLIGRTWYGDVEDARAPVNAPPFRMEGDRIVLNIGVRYLEKTHEQQIHLIVVSKDLREFAHIHPQLQPNGEWAVEYKFPHAGDWLIYADYTKPGEAPRVDRFTWHSTDNSAEPAKAASLALSVKLSTPQHIHAGEDVDFRFEVGVTDLQPYLGAWAHVIFISADGEDFIHAHPADDVSSAPSNPWQHVHAVPGPSPSLITATTGFRRAGDYKVWLQVRRDGDVLTLPYSIHVEPALAKPPATLARPDAIRLYVSSSGFDPARIQTTPGQDLHLAVLRRDAQNCATSIVFPELNIKRDLPPGETVSIDIPASVIGAEAREFHFACGMNMFRGSVLVR